MWAEKYIQESEDEIDEVMDRRGTFKPYEAPREENEEVTIVVSVAFQWYSRKKKIV